MSTLFTASAFADNIPGTRRPLVASPAAYFSFYVITRPKDIFIIKLTKPDQIKRARKILSGEETRAVHVMGTVVKSQAPYNKAWSYQLAPDSITFFENAIEVCDGAIHYVEEHLKEVGGAFLPKNVFCPWGSILKEELMTIY